MTDNTYDAGYQAQSSWLAGKTVSEAQACLTGRLGSAEDTPYNQGGTQATRDYIAKISADRVASIDTPGRAGWRVARGEGHPEPTAEDVAKHLPPNYRVGDVQSWRMIVRGQDNDDATLEDVIAALAKAGITAKPVEREGINAVYQFRTGRDGGSGSFLSPPGHPAHAYSIYGYHSSGKGRPRTNRPSGPDSIMGIESLAEDEGGYYPKWAVEKARRLLAGADMEPSELWVRNVYGYFRNSYSPDGVDRNVSNALSAGKVWCRCGESFYNRRGLGSHISSLSGPRGGYRGHEQVDGPEYPPEHHLGYLFVRSYFPNHQIRADLIADPGNGYGAHKCPKCEQHVQYEARHDAFCVVTTSPWSYNPDCPAGGKHE